MSLKETTGNPSKVIEELFDCYHSRLYWMSFRILGNSADAEDALQDGFLKAFQALDTFRGEASVYSWLYRIVQNECIAKLRQRKRARLLSVEASDTTEMARALRDPKPRPDRQVGAAQLASLLDDCVRELPEKYRTAFILRDVENLSEKGVCGALGLPISTVKSRIHRARSKMRQMIASRVGESRSPHLFAL